jgi:PAS domain S-box-containing protein
VYRSVDATRIRKRPTKRVGDATAGANCLTGRTMAPIRPCLAWLAVVAAVMATFAATPATVVGLAAYAVVSLGAIVAVVLGLRRGQPPDPLPWRLVAATLTVFAVGDLAIFLFYDQATGSAPLSDVAYLVGYGLLLWAIGRMMLRGTTAPDLAALLDAAILAIAVAPLAWAFLRSRAGELTGSGVVQALAIAYPLADVALLAAVILLLISGAWVVVAGRLLSIAVACLLAADIAAGWLRLNDVDPVTSRANLLWLAAAGALGAAALHPSMAALSGPVRAARETRGRFVLLALATLAAPMLVAAQAAGVLAIGATPVAAAAVLVSVLVAGRIAGVGGRLEAVLSQYQALVEQIPAAVYTRRTGADALAYASPRFRDLLGYEPDAIVGASDFLDERVHPDDRGRVEAEDARTDETGDPFVSEYRLRAADGGWRWMHNEALLVRDGNGRPLHWQGVLTDISALRGAEAARRRSELLFRSAFEGAPIGMALVAPDGRFLRVNGALGEILGLDEPALLARSFPDLIHPEDLAADRDLLRRTLAGELPGFRREQRCLHADGRVIDALLGLTVVRDDAGQPIHFVAQVLDISGQKAAEAALAAERDLLAALMQHLPDAVFVKDDQRRLLRFNDAFAEMLGIADPAEALGKTDAELLPGDAAQRVAAIDRAVLAGRADRNRLHELVVDGEPRWMRSSKAPLRDAAGQVVGLVGVHRDVTEEHRATEQLRAAEERFRSLVEQLPVAVYVDPADALGAPAYVSPQIETLLGYTPAEWLADPDLWLDRIHPDDRATVVADLHRSRQAETQFRGEYRAIARDGRVVWLRDHAVLVVHELGSRRYWQGVLLDISEPRRAEAALRQHADRLAAVIAAQIEVAAVELDPQHVMDVVAARAQALVGADGAAVELVDGADIVYRAATGSAAVYLGRRRSIAESLSGLCVRTGEPQISGDAETDPRVDAATVRRSGARSSVVVPLRHRSQVVGVLKAIDGAANAFDEDDVRALHLLAGLIGGALANAEAYAAMREARAAAEEASRLKSQFLSTMSHELRTPMNAIIGYAHLLLDGMAGNLTSAQASDVRQIAEGGDRLLSLIDDVLDLSRIESGRFTIEPRRLDLGPIVAQVLAGVAPQAAAKRLTVRSRLPEDLPPVLADTDRLHQVLLNVVGNAVKFTDQGAVEVSARAQDGSVVVAVADSGIGIAPEALPSIFDEFRQADSSTTRRFGGSGLGLAIARRLLALQGGAIAVESTLGVGSTFTVTVPAAGATALVEGAASPAGVPGG